MARAEGEEEAAEASRRCSCRRPSFSEIMFGRRAPTNRNEVRLEIWGEVLNERLLCCM